MSIWSDSQIKQLLERVEELERQIGLLRMAEDQKASPKTLTLHGPGKEKDRTRN